MWLEVAHESHNPVEVVSRVLQHAVRCTVSCGCSWRPGRPAPERAAPMKFVAAWEADGTGCPAIASLHARRLPASRREADEATTTPWSPSGHTGATHVFFSYALPAGDPSSPAPLRERRLHLLRCGKVRRCACPVIWKTLGHLGSAGEMGCPLYRHKPGSSNVQRRHPSSPHASCRAVLARLLSSRTRTRCLAARWIIASLSLRAVVHSRPAPAEARAFTPSLRIPPWPSHWCHRCVFTPSGPQADVSSCLGGRRRGVRVERACVRELKLRPQRPTRSLVSQRVSEGHRAKGFWGERPQVAKVEGCEGGGGP